MAGRPPEHLKEAMNNHIESLRRIKDVVVRGVAIGEPKEVPVPEGQKISKEKIIYSTFAEVEFETMSLSRLSEIMFDFMPSSIEVTDPANLTVSSNEATDLMNNISGRLHRYDELARIAQFRIKQLATQLEEANKSNKISEKKPAKKTAPKKKAVSKKSNVKKSSKKKK